jgi:LuxR family transcriptional regulator, maltose regulon positive regulatory protein
MVIRQAMIEILSAKVSSPRLRNPYVVRTALLAQLDKGLERRLTLISAPAGFGKTHLVGQWIARGTFSVGWLTLDEGDNDPVRFVRYLIAACQSLVPDIGTSALAALNTPQQYPLDAVVMMFLNDLARLQGVNVVVLEDYHNITSPLVHQFMAFLLEHLPEALHLVIITRTDPPLPLARLRAQDELHELRSSDLQFGSEETENFVRQFAFIPQSEAIAATLTQLTEGWIVGIRLIMLSLQRRPPSEHTRFLATFTGGHQHILDYLWSEVLAAQSVPLRTFLLQTAFLNRLSSSLCDAVTMRSDSNDLLRTLERSNLFLFPLDDTRTWYRLHPLVAEAMQHLAHQHFNDDEIRQLYSRARTWYETNGYLSEAVEAGLAAQDFAQTAALIERIIEPQLVKRNYEYYTLRRWIERIPDTILALHPTLCQTVAVAILFTSDRHAPNTASAIQKPLAMAEAAWAAEGNTGKLGELLAFRALVEYWQGNYTRLFETSEQALKLLPESQIEWRSILLLNLAMREWLAGDTAAARQLIQESQQLNKVINNHYTKRSSLVLLGQVALAQGRLYEAEQVFQELRALSAHQRRDQARAIIGLCAVAFERNDLNDIGHHLEEALAIAEAEGDKHVLVEAATLLARVKQAQGDPDTARALVRNYASRVGMNIHARALRAWDAWLALTSGDVGTANGWAEAYGQNSHTQFTLQAEHEALITARLKLAHNEPHSTHVLLDKWLKRAAAGERKRSELELLILKALVFFREKRLAHAKAALLQALEFAYREGHARAFLQEGDAVATLLKDISASDNLELAAFIHMLLRSFESEQARNDGTTRLEVLSAIDPLSPQEQRVFLLIAEGQSNPDIADALGVSVNTVKTQVKSIYSKLNVNTRRQAREMARMLNLF